MARIRIELPTLHVDQVRAYNQPGRFKALRAGRRWGKTSFAEVIACDGAIKSERVGWFAPDYKRLSEAFRDMKEYLKPILLSSSAIEGVIRTKTHGSIECWTLADESAGRSRKYHKVIIDEAAFTKPNMLAIWERSIAPTLLDYQGTALVCSNTRGIDPENFMYLICTEPRFGFVEFHAPSISNPTIPAHLPGETDEQWEIRRKGIFEKLEADNHPLVWQQEYLAEFVDWSGVAFFDKEKLLVNGQPVEMPRLVDGVFAIIDTAIKTGAENDGTAVLYAAKSTAYGHPLVLLDWDVQQIEGASLEAWLPNVFVRLEELAQATEARMGSIGAFIEDKNSGTILLQQAARRSLNVHPIDSKLTAMGKDERAISVSGYVFRGMVKIYRGAFDKVSQYKGITRNHLMAQILGFRVGDKEARGRPDDLFDCFAYAVALGLGDSEGF